MPTFSGRRIPASAGGGGGGMAAALRKGDMVGSAPAHGHFLRRRCIMPDDYRPCSTASAPVQDGIARWPRSWGGRGWCRGRGGSITPRGLQLATPSGWGIPPTAPPGREASQGYRRGGRFATVSSTRLLHEAPHGGAGATLPENTRRAQDRRVVVSGPGAATWCD